MNAAAKFVNQGTLSRQWVLTVFFTRTQVMLSVSLFMIFMTAFSVVYITNASRDLHASLYQGRSEYNHLYAEQGQLLLEQGTLGMEARVQHVAERTLNMMIPDRQSVVMIHE